VFGFSLSAQKTTGYVFKSLTEFKHVGRFDPIVILNEILFEINANSKQKSIFHYYTDIHKSNYQLFRRGKSYNPYLGYDKIYYHKPLIFKNSTLLMLFYNTAEYDVVIEIDEYDENNLLSRLFQTKFGLVKKLPENSRFEILSVFKDPQGTFLETDFFILAKYTINNKTEYPVYIIPYYCGNKACSFDFFDLDTELMNQLSPMALKNYEAVVNKLKKIKR